jgi:hypothetical protein
VVVGPLMFNSVGPLATISTNVGMISLQDSHVALIETLFADCAAESMTQGSGSISFGASSAYGGAFALLHSLQATLLLDGLQQLLSPFIGPSYGSDLTIAVVKLSFSRCSALSKSTSGRSSQADAVGGALFAKSVALSNFTASDSHFSSCFVNVVAGAGDILSRSSGGAVRIDFSSPGYSVASFSVCSFFNCTARGALIRSLAVTGGGVALSHVKQVLFLDSNFFKCQLQGAQDDQSFDYVDVAISDGAAASLSHIRNVSIKSCVFDAADVQGSSTGAMSMGLAIMSSVSPCTHVDVSDTALKSSRVVFSVRCVSADGFFAVACPVFGPFVSVSNSSILQITPANDGVFRAVGSALMLFDVHSAYAFNKFGMRCALPEFAVFRDRSVFATAVSIEYSCKACRPFEVSVSANEVWLERTIISSNSSNCLRLSDANECPYGIKRCQTFVDVQKGFWTDFAISGRLLDASRCPDNYCRCDSTTDSCRLASLLSAEQRSDSLCQGSRSGVLCGGCKPNFTHSLNGYSCISNEECMRNLGWVWTITVVGFTLYSIYIVITSSSTNDGFIMCVVFYEQMSHFARIPPVFSDQAENSKAASWFSKVSQFSSMVSFYERSCYGPNMGAYEATVAQLAGPFIVLVMSMLLIFPFQKFFSRYKYFFNKRKLDIQVSSSVTLMNVLLMVFSSVSSVIFQLITCQDTGKDKVIFIDGTKPCSGPAFNGSIVVASVLAIVPFGFWALLKYKKIPERTRAIVCSPYSDSRYYWVALTLIFRFLVSVLSSNFRQYPSLSAMALSICSGGMLMLLLALSPYVERRTYYMDVFCHACLTIQFMLQCLAGASESLGLSLNINNRFYATVRGAAAASDILKCESFIHHLLSRCAV